MRNFILASALAMAMATAACDTTGGYGAAGAGYGAPPAGGTRLSSCMRNALIGAGVGALTGALAGSKNNRGENAALGAVIAGGGTFAICKYLDNQQQARIESAYRNALASNQPVGMNWVGASSRTYVLNVERPQPVAGNPQCRNVNATLNVNNQGAQPLPTETYCNTTGVWTPVA